MFRMIEGTLITFLTTILFVSSISRETIAPFGMTFVTRTSIDQGFATNTMRTFTDDEFLTCVGLVFRVSIDSRRILMLPSTNLRQLFR